MVYSAPDCAIAVPSVQGLVVNEANENSVNKVPNSKFLCFASDLKCERVVWEKVLKAKRTIVFIFFVCYCFAVC